MSWLLLMLHLLLLVYVSIAVVIDVGDGVAGPTSREICFGCPVVVAVAVTATANLASAVVASVISPHYSTTLLQLSSLLSELAVIDRQGGP